MTLHWLCIAVKSDQLEGKWWKRSLLFTLWFHECVSMSLQILKQFDCLKCIAALSDPSHLGAGGGFETSKGFNIKQMQRAALMIMLLQYDKVCMYWNSTLDSYSTAASSTNSWQDGLAKCLSNPMEALQRHCNGEILRTPELFRMLWKIEKSLGMLLQNAFAKWFCKMFLQGFCAVLCVAQHLDLWPNHSRLSELQSLSPWQGLVQRSKGPNLVQSWERCLSVQLLQLLQLQLARLARVSFYVPQYWVLSQDCCHEKETKC